MGRHCCVPGCTSNYRTSDPHVSVFSFPKNEERKRVWLAKIKRQDFSASQTSVVCIKHFSERFIERESRAVCRDGSVVSMKRKAPILKNDAYPSIFDSYPNYLSEEAPPKRQTSPNTRRLRQEAHDKEVLDNFFTEDCIKSFLALVQQYKQKINISESWVFNTTQNCFIVYKPTFEPIPKISVCIKIKLDFSTEIWHDNIRLNSCKFTWLLGKDSKCDRWSKLDNLLTHLNSYTNTK